MIVIGTRAAQQASRRHLILPNGTGYYKGEYMPAAPGAAVAPHAFLVEQDPDTTIESHFHQQNQFQVIVGGRAMLGRHAVAPLLVHYAGAYTGYGPIVSGSDGLHYLTLRPAQDPGAQFLPGARGRLLRGPKRHFSSEPIATLDAAALRALAAPRTEEILAPQADGLAVLLYRLPPGAVAHGIDPATGAGQYLMAAGGSFVHGGRVLGVPETLFITPDEAAPAITAGPDGAEVLLLQFPPLASEYQPA
jgi:hypothetical protein